MNEQDYKYHYEMLEALDPDQLVADLDLESADIMARFPNETRNFIINNFG